MNTERILDAIYDEVHFEMNPGDEECPECGGDGWVHDCFDGFCEDAEYGCEECARRCLGCAQFEHKIDAAVRTEVLRAMNIDLAIAFLKRTKKWSDKISRQAVLANLHAGRVASKEFTPEEREASACWVECLL